MFESIDGHLTTIFNKVEGINTGFGNTKEEIDDIIKTFNKFVDSQDFGNDWDDFLDTVNSKNTNVADMLEKVAKQGKEAKVSIQDFYAATLKGATTGYKNVQSVIEKFKSIEDPSRQKDFAKAVKQTNANLGQYLNNVQAGSASMQEYSKQLVSAKVKTIALQAKTMALNAILNTAFAWGIGKLFEGLDTLVNYTDDLAEAAGNAVSKLSSLKEESKSLMKHFNDLSSDFEKLSKGVNGFGDNVSLTTDEYNRYKEITNQIANDIPTLIKGYDNEGNAILSLKDNVGELRQAYIDAAKAKNSLAISDSDNEDIVKNYKSNIGTDGFLSRLSRSFTDELFSASAGHLIDNYQAKDTLEFALNSSYEDVMSFIKSHNFDLRTSYLFSLGINEKIDKDEFYDLKNELKSELISVQSILDESLNDMKSLADSYMRASDDYYNLDTNMQNLVSSLINSMTIEETADFKNSNDVGTYVLDIIDKIKDADEEVKHAYNNLIKLDVDSIDPDQAKAIIDKNIDVLADHLALNKEKLKVTLGVDIEFDKTDREKTLQAAKQQFIKFSLKPDIEYPDASEIENYLENLSDEDLSYAVKIPNLFKDGVSGANEMLEYYKTIHNLSSETKSISEETVESIKNSLSLQSNISSIIKEQEENGRISNDNVLSLIENGYQAALSYDAQSKSYSVLTSKVEELNKARNAELLTTLKSQRADLISKHNKEANAIEELRIRTGRAADDIVIQQKLEEISIDDVVSAYDAYISMLEDADTVTSDFSDTISKITSKIDEYKESVKSLGEVSSIVKNATEEQNTFGRISANTINALHEAGLDGAMSYNEMTGETYFLVDAIDELTRAMNDNQKANIEKSITDTTNAIAKAREDIKNLGVIDSVDDVARALQINQYIDELEGVLSELNLQKQITTSFNFSFETDTDLEDIKESAEEAAEKYITAVKEAFEKEKSELDHLLNMDVISHEEYYNSLFNLNEEYFKGKTELLDEYRQYEEEIYKGLKEVQINALQEQIDALKSVNEEKQEEIDLEKAKQALENAKRQRNVRVYDSERGWIYETDRNAIDSAQKEYDDLVLNEKVEALENLIDAIENGTNTTHSLDESINAWEQINSLGQTVVPGDIDLSKLFNGAAADIMRDIKNSMYTNAVPTILSNQFGKSISSDSYTTNNKTTYINVEEVVAENPMAFISQMEQIADKSFEKNFPPAMNEFGRSLKRYKANHSR